MFRAPQTWSVNVDVSPRSKMSRLQESRDIIVKHVFLAHKEDRRNESLHQKTGCCTFLHKSSQRVMDQMPQGCLPLLASQRATVSVTQGCVNFSLSRTRLFSHFPDFCSQSACPNPNLLLNLFILIREAGSFTFCIELKTWIIVKHTPGKMTVVAGKKVCLYSNT